MRKEILPPIFWFFSLFCLHECISLDSLDIVQTLLRLIYRGSAKKLTRLLFEAVPSSNTQLKAALLLIIFLKTGIFLLFTSQMNKNMVWARFYIIFQKNHLLCLECYFLISCYLKFYDCVKFYVRMCSVKIVCKLFDPIFMF